MRQIIFTIIIIATIFACSFEKQQKYVRLSGKTMGTTYHLIVGMNESIDLGESVDSILIAINKEVNTYDAHSLISNINSLDGNVVSFAKNDGQHFVANFHKAQQIFNLTDGLFDPTVMPLVNYWGFGPSGRKKVTEVDSAYIDSLKTDVGFQYFSLTETEDSVQLSKEKKNAQLDFSALAKGYAVDVIAEFLEQMHINDYLVEIGGETRAKGLSDRDRSFVIGISKPQVGAPQDDFVQRVQLPDLAIATSGNYRNYYQVGDQAYWHSINPKTGFPEQNEILSASIMSSNCMEADAIATACMILGLEKSKNILTEMPQIELFIVYMNREGEMKTYQSSGFSAAFLNE